MRIIITGAGGQLGQALQRALGTSDLVPLTRAELDVADPGASDRLAGLKPEVVIHCAAWTDVDGCARQPDRAYKINAFGAQNVALGCQRAGAALVYISTNEVFDGQADEPYHELAPTHPLNPYAQSKLAGEQMAARLLQRLYIVRTAWVFARGGDNFPAKIIRAADERGELRVVTDEVSNPTYAPDLAGAIAQLIETGHYGIYHFTNEGACSRYEYAVEILKQSGRASIPVRPITSDAFQRASTPPPYAPLKNTAGAALGIRLRPWPAALADYIYKG
ncbi:MAG: dTDP-4-dehydrorhamnose reductase [Anaerolineae bacterium]